MDGFSFAWALNFLLMLGVLAFTEALKSQLTSSYYNENIWKRGGKIYKYPGIDFFRKLLVWSGWEKLVSAAHPIEKNTTALMNLHQQTKNVLLNLYPIFLQRYNRPRIARAINLSRGIKTVF